MDYLAGSLNATWASFAWETNI